MERQIENNENEEIFNIENDEQEEQVPEEYLNEKLDIIMSKLEALNVEKEVGEREKNRDVRLIIEKIELENFKSYAGLKRIGPLHYVSILS